MAGKYVDAEISLAGELGSAEFAGVLRRWRCPRSEIALLVRFVKL
jgi:hypothetical protein